MNCFVFDLENNKKKKHLVRSERNKKKNLFLVLYSSQYRGAEVFFLSCYQFHENICRFYFRQKKKTNPPIFVEKNSCQNWQCYNEMYLGNFPFFSFNV